MTEEETNSVERIHTRISKGYQVVVPSELRKRYGVGVGDAVLWKISSKENEVSIELEKKPSLSAIVALGRSGRKGNSSVKLKKKLQKGKL